MSAPDAHPDPHRFDDGRPHVNNGSSNGHLNGHSNGHANGSSNRRNLSEISHLFLSDLRALNGTGRTPPTRTPPGAQGSAASRNDETIDLTPDEFGDVSDSEAADDRTPVAAVIGARLDGTLIRRACQYAASLGADRPVGLVVVEATGVRLLCVSNDASELPDEQDASPLVVSTSDELHEAMLEMGCDIDRWLVVLPDPRLPHARRLLAMIPDWVLLTVARHEGVVAGYRTLKGLCDLPRPDVDDVTAMPHITLALLDAESAAEAEKHARKLMGVCKQFLDLEMSADVSTGSEEGEAASTGSAASIGEFVVQEVVTAFWPDVHSASKAWPVLEAVLIGEEDDGNFDGAPTPPFTDRSGTDQSKTHTPNGGIAMFQDSRQDHSHHSQPSRAPQTRVDEAFIPPMARPAPAHPARPEPRPAADAWVAASQEQAEARRRLADAIDVPGMARPTGQPAGVSPEAARGATVGPRFPQAPAEGFVGRIDSEPRRPAPAFPAMPAPHTHAHDEEVIDLPAGASVAEVVLGRLDVATTPLVPPMLAGGRLCVDRSGGLLLIAGAAPGLTDLAAIGRAMTWVTENRQLIGMALAQYRIADAGDVRLHLLVSHSDANADALRPLLGTGCVTVQSYRRLTWAGRCGVLLEAA